MKIDNISNHNNGDFDFRDSMLYNVKKSSYHTSVPTVEWLAENYIARDGGVSMTGNLNAGDNSYKRGRPSK